MVSIRADLIALRWAIRIRHSTIWQRLEKYLALDLLSFACIFGFAVTFLEWHNCVVASALFSFGCMSLALRCTLASFKLNSNWRYALIVLALVVVVSIDNYLMSMVAQKEDAYWAEVSAKIVAEEGPVAIKRAMLTIDIPKWAAINKWGVISARPTILMFGKKPYVLYALALPSGGIVSVGVSHKWPELLQVQSSMDLPSDLRKILNHLSRQQQSDAFRDIKLVLSQAKIPWSIQQQTLTLYNPTPIIGLNSFTFSKAVAEVDDDIAYVSTKIEQIIKSYAKHKAV
jgi:hypothetical protein